MNQPAPDLIRFDTAGDVVAAFPMIVPFLPIKPANESPLAFLAMLTEHENPYGAPAFAAHILPRRECIDFLCAAFRLCAPPPAPPGDPDVKMVEDWARHPDENRRLAALARAEALEKTEPVTWALLAVGWSGGNIMSDDKLPPVPAPVQLTPQAVAAALSLALARVPPGQVRDTVAAWTKACIDIAHGRKVQK